ncbi:hypothetical protein HDU86_007997 [Geranomyces michiganensis]|nr:hypothetical protein HDU86_007997 [Geranomyces michiganensis]
MSTAVAVPKHMLSRLLYPNPVCLLTVAAAVPASNETEDSGADAAAAAEVAWDRNVMTISWITATDNHGRFVCSINLNRRSCTLVRRAMAFVLNIAPASLQPLLLAVGSTSGHDTADKFTALSIPTCEPGFQPTTSIRGTQPEHMPAIPTAAAHCECVVEEWSERNGHAVLFCRVLRGWARREWWDGRCLGSVDDPLLSFMGSKLFAHVIPERKPF